MVTQSEELTVEESLEGRKIRTVFTEGNYAGLLQLPPRGSPRSNLLQLQPSHCNVAPVYFVKSKANLKGLLTLFGSPLSPRWNWRFFTIWSHLPSLPPHLIPTQCTLYASATFQMSIVGVSIQGASGTFLGVHRPQVADPFHRLTLSTV